MEKITVNTDVTANRIMIATNEAIATIKKNADNGIAKTELEIDNDIASEVKRNLKSQVEGIEFLIVDRRPNQYTGQMNYFESRKEGDKRIYKVSI